MLYTPRTKRQETQTTQYSTNLSRLSKRNTTEISNDECDVWGHSESLIRQETEKLRPVAKLSITVRRQKASSPSRVEDSPKVRVNPAKYRTNIVSKMSSRQHGPIQAYGISTLKGAKNIINPHYLSLNLGRLNSITLSESFDGHTAAKLAKQQFRSQLTTLTEQPHIIFSQTVKETFNRVQQKLMDFQLESRDNSGTTLLAVIADSEFVTVGNAGASQVVCETRFGSFLKLSESHNTYNEKETKRIVKNGGRLYQTVVNVPFQQDLQIQGPLRVSPSGLTFTRCLGKSLNISKQIANLPTRQNPQQNINITWKPQIRYIKTSEVQWLGIFSEAVVNNCSYDYIRQCVRQQIKKKAEDYTQHHIAMEISRKIVDKLASQGVAEAISVVIVFFTNLAPNNQNTVIINAKGASRLPKNEIPLPPKEGYSLKYLGNRKSFVKSVESSSRGSSMKSKDQFLTDKIRKELRNDFSFSNFN